MRNTFQEQLMSICAHRKGDDRVERVVGKLLLGIGSDTKNRRVWPTIPSTASIGRV